MPTALITGVTGQDGSYLAEFLLSKGYEVWGLIRKLSYPNHARVEHLVDRIKLITGDLTDQSSLTTVMAQVQPDEVYNLAAQSFVPESWTQPLLTSEVTGLGVARLLEAVRYVCPNARFYQASTSEMFGISSPPQSEFTPFHPRSPYGVSKVYAHSITVNYRESYGLFTCSGVLFNHESPRRGVEFLTRKVSRAVAEIVHGSRNKLRLGNLDARRDWGYAPEYVEAMWAMLQQDTAADYVIATGVAHSVREWVTEAFAAANLDWRDYVDVDPALFRPAEVPHLCGDPTKARNILGWSPRTSMQELVRIMVEHDIADLRNEMRDRA